MAQNQKSLRKKYITISTSSFLILFLGAVLYSCSSSSKTSLNEKDSSGTNFVTGQILMVENEPFVKLALLSDSTVYLLECPDEMNNEIYKNQGKEAKVYYRKIFKNKESVKVLDVEKVEIYSGKP
jgi:hypothetical protein